MAIVLFVGLVIGGAVAWVVASSLAQRWWVSERREVETRAVAAESTAVALRQQLDERGAELETARRSLDAERQVRVAAETRLSEAAKGLEEQRKLLNDAEQKLLDAFKALSADALKSNSQTFLQLAKQSLETVAAEAKGDLDQRREAVNTLIKPLEEALKRYETQAQTLERTRQEAYGGLREQLTTLAKTTQQLQHESQHLVSALRRPQARGRWGELTLRRVVELAGMSEHCDYAEQVSIQDEEARFQPDMVVRLPGGRQVIVDAKTPLNAYLDAIESSDDESRRTLLTQHVSQMRDHMGQLSSKRYWEKLPEACDFVVMFIPGESFLAAALEQDRSLIEDGMENRVVIATPTTLVALLRAIAYGWRQEQITKNAMEVARIGRETYERIQAFLGHVETTRKHLTNSVFAFNRMLGSLEGRILPSLRRFRELGATGGEELPVLEPIEQTPRRIELASEATDRTVGKLEEIEPAEADE